MHLTLYKAQEITAKHSTAEVLLTEVTELSDLPSARFQIYQCSASTGARSFVIVYQHDNRSASQAATDVPSISKTLDLVSSQTDIRLPPHVVDTSRSVIPHDFIYVDFMDAGATGSADGWDYISLHEAVAGRKLDAQQLAALHLRLGVLVAQVHAIQNDFFGFPLTPEGSIGPTDKSVVQRPTSKIPISIIPPDSEPPNSYSWQETFVHFFDDVLHNVQLHKATNADLVEDVSFQDIQTYLSRAIAFYLFDDVEVPSLVSFSLSTKDIILRIPRDDSVTSLSTSDPEIHHVLPTFAGSLVYGDPLLQSLFSKNISNLDEEAPLCESEAFLEGYGTRLIMFKRQRTKRLWYDLYLALMVLARRAELEPTFPASEARKQILAEVKKCVMALKDAPCY